jgi:exonuclease VII large subunit
MELTTSAGAFALFVKDLTGNPWVVGLWSSAVASLSTFIAMELFARRRVNDAVDEALSEQEEEEEERTQQLKESHEADLSQFRASLLQQVEQEVGQMLNQTVQAERDAFAIQTRAMQERLQQVEGMAQKMQASLMEKDRLLTEQYNQVRYYANECEAYQNMVKTFDAALKESERDKAFLLSKLESLLPPSQLERIQGMVTEQPPNGNSLNGNSPKTERKGEWSHYSEVTTSPKR